MIRPELLINDLQWLSDKYGIEMAEFAEIFADICDYVIECNDRGITVEKHLHNIRRDDNSERTTKTSR